MLVPSYPEVEVGGGEAAFPGIGCSAVSGNGLTWPAATVDLSNNFSYNEFFRSLNNIKFHERVDELKSLGTYE